METFTSLGVIVSAEQLSAQAMLVVVTAPWLGPQCLLSVILTLLIPRRWRTQLPFKIPPLCAGVPAPWRDLTNDL